MNTVPFFISWSGEEAKQLANLIAEFLKDLDRAFAPWVSDTGLTIGYRTQVDQILQSIETAKAHIIILTKQNQSAPWINYEAGAASVNGKASTRPIIPILVDLEITDVQGPIGAFQSKIQPDFNGLKTLATSLAKHAGSETEEHVDRVFGTFWAAKSKAIISQVQKIRQSSKPRNNRALKNKIETVRVRVDTLERELSPAQCEIVSQLIDDVTEILRIKNGLTLDDVYQDLPRLRC